MMAPLASVIIPTYNSARWIRETLASIASQKYPNVEVVIVDDGSKDDTVAICRSHGGVTVVPQANQGRGAARNHGLQAARGEFLAFLDHDDLLKPGSIEDRVRFLQTNPDFDWLFTDAVEFDDSGDLRLYLDQFPWLDLRGDPFRQLLRGTFPLMSTVMMRRSLVERTGGFDRRYNYGDDIEYFLRLLLVSRVGMIRAPLSRRRIHPDQGVSSNFDRWKSRIDIYTDFLAGSHPMSPGQRRAVRHALRHSYFKLGEWHWEEYRREEARSHFLRSIGPCLWSIRALVYSGLTHAPISALRGLRRRKAAWKQATFR